MGNIILQYITTAGSPMTIPLIKERCLIFFSNFRCKIIMTILILAYSENTEYDNFETLWIVFSKKIYLSQIYSAKGELYKDHQCIYMWISINSSNIRLYNICGKLKNITKRFSHKMSGHKQVFCIITKLCRLIHLKIISYIYK